MLQTLNRAAVPCVLQTLNRATVNCVLKTLNRATVNCVLKTLKRATVPHNLEPQTLPPCPATLRSAPGHHVSDVSDKAKAKNQVCLYLYKRTLHAVLRLALRAGAAACEQRHACGMTETQRDWVVSSVVGAVLVCELQTETSPCSCVAKARGA